jgi:hypothetical protein
LLAGDTRVFTLFAALAVVAVAGRTGTVDFLALVEVGRSRRKLATRQAANNENRKRCNMRATPEFDAANCRISQATEN